MTEITPTRSGELRMDDWYEEDEREFTDVISAAAPLTDDQLEHRYDFGGARIVTQRNDFLIPNLLASIKEKQYVNLNPPYQRRLRWDRRRMSKFIESLLMNVPIPPVFLFETDLAQYEVMDGQQRLSTIQRFFDNEFPLTGLEVWADLNKRRYLNLPPRIRSGLLRRSVSAIILLSESSTEIKPFVFERLNTGGVRLNPQEIRNAVYTGPFNDLLHELSRMPPFTEVWDIPPVQRGEETRPTGRLSTNRLYTQMLDCEIVLRFFTLAQPGLLTTSMRTSLDNTMKRYTREVPNIPALRTEFTECLTTAISIYQSETFRLFPSRSTSRRTPSRGLFDAVMLGLHNIRNGAGEHWPETRSTLVERRIAVVEATNQLVERKDAYSLLVGRMNTRQSILDRIALLTDIFTRILNEPR